jgi:hypothetical protein
MDARLFVVIFAVLRAATKRNRDSSIITNDCFNSIGHFKTSRRIVAAAGPAPIAPIAELWPASGRPICDLRAAERHVRSQRKLSRRAFPHGCPLTGAMLATSAICQRAPQRQRRQSSISRLRKHRHHEAATVDASVPINMRAPKPVSTAVEMASDFMLRSQDILTSI